mgnify:CR=1 FL=1
MQKRKAIIIKEFICKIVIAIGFILIMAAGCSIDASENYIAIMKTGAIGTAMMISAYKLYLY